MSYVDLLFPQAELEALGNKWHEPAPKRRKLAYGDAQVVKEALGSQRRHSNEAGSGQRRHRLSTPTSYQYGVQSRSSEQMKPRITKRANSDSQPLLSSMAGTSIPAKHATSTAAAAATTKSCLPSFIEPSILKNYLRHLHPKDSHRYTVPNSPNTESHVLEEAVSSPGSLVADSTPSPASTDSCSTPAALCEQFRSGPFGHLFDGMRLTDNERDLMEDLLSPIPVQSQDETPSQKRKQADVQIAPENYYEIDESLLQSMFDASTGKGNHGVGTELAGPFNTETDFDVHSSGLSPAADDAEEEEVPSHRGIVVYDYNALSVHDFFDLDEAST